MDNTQNSHLERFDAYMERCLYSNGGFYNSAEQTTGSRGSFITSPEVGSLFGAVVANWIRDEAAKTTIKTVYDVGSNRGTLVAELRSQLPDLEVLGVDYQNGDLTPDEFETQDLSNAIVFANELLDNLPFRYCRKAGTEIEEAFVSNSELVWQRAELETDVANKFETIDDGLTFPVHGSSQQWISSVLSRNPLSLLMIDYGMATTAELAKRGDWLRTYQGHIVDVDPLASPGQIDITTDIGFDQLPTPMRTTAQAEFLVENGIDALVEEGMLAWEAQKAAPDLASLRMKSRKSQSKALMDPRGLGSWIVAEWS